MSTPSDEHDDDWNEAIEPAGLGWFDEAGDLLAAFVISFIIAGIVYTFGL
jgi:hypothetical protein